ncbi:hypothetical protein OS493_004500 [Desmophyllum pertusum]|uniref:Uncharacterized protein n=1 Tax=Desmophyllum pertusum TaxID=174260 RepID=A0A9W9ZGA1_9CNID|nr:hypothetical protein OS493_004500 [Desmophyllum pertusum]
MDCVIWAAEKAKAFSDEENESDEEQSFVEDGILQEKDKEELRGTVPRPSTGQGERFPNCQRRPNLHRMLHKSLTTTRIVTTRNGRECTTHDGGNESEDEERLYITPVPPRKRLSADVVSTGVSDCAISESAETEKVQEFPGRDESAG